MRLLFGLFLLSLAACGERPSAGSDSSAKASSAPTTAPTEDAGAKQKKAIADATKSWLSLHEIWRKLAATSDAKSKPPAACTKAASPSTKPGLSIGQTHVVELAAEGAPHNPNLFFGGTTSGRLSSALKLPFTDKERSNRDWNPDAAATALAQIEKDLFPLTVLRIDDFVAPQVTGKDTFRAGRARATVFFFEDKDTACTLTVSTTSDKSVSAMTLDGNTGGDEVVNARLANDLEQSVQRAAGAKLAELGKVGSLEPVVPGKTP
jgi:hypothetical protein